MEHYVTLFDSLFLPQGLALHISMERHIKNYVLWILCVDDEVYEVLKKLNLPNVNLLQLSKLETAELLSVKFDRNKAEYCWTLTPFSTRFVFENDENVSRVTYLDADIWFRKDPAPIFNEFHNSKKTVLITDHAYSAENDLSALAGQYCVQFMTFTRDAELVRKWWEDRCIEWCFSYFEEGKFGDQKYLDDWPVRFSKFVHVLLDKELMLAPWNATRFPYGNCIIWHFHSLRIVSCSDQELAVDFGDYSLPDCTIKNVYEPYLQDLKLAQKKLLEFGLLIKQQKIPSKKSKTNILKSLFCRR